MQAGVEFGSSQGQEWLLVLCHQMFVLPLRLQSGSMCWPLSCTYHKNTKDQGSLPKSARANGRNTFSYGVFWLSSSVLPLQAVLQMSLSCWRSIKRGEKLVSRYIPQRNGVKLPQRGPLSGLRTTSEDAVANGSSVCCQRVFEQGGGSLVSSVGPPT